VNTEVRSHEGYFTAVLNPLSGYDSSYVSIKLIESSDCSELVLFGPHEKLKNDIQVLIAQLQACIK